MYIVYANRLRVDAYNFSLSYHQAVEQAFTLSCYTHISLFIITHIWYKFNLINIVQRIIHKM